MKIFEVTKPKEIGIHRSAEDFAVIDLSKSSDGTFWLNGVDNTDWDATVTSGKGVDIAFEISTRAKLASYDDIDKYSIDELENMGYDGVRMTDGDNVAYQIWNTDVLKRTKLGENSANSKKMSVKDMLDYINKHHSSGSRHSDYVNHVTDTNDYFELTSIDLKSIRTELGGLEKDKVEKYKQMDFSKAPPIVVGSDNNILDGYHRANVALELGLRKIPAWVGRKDVAENFAGDTTLYHATYRPLLKSITAQGLGGNAAQAKWHDSKPGVVYLAKDPEVARSYAETSDIVPEEWLDHIVVLAINTSVLDQRKIHPDRNVLDDDSTMEYHGVISDFAIMENFADGKVKGKSRPGRAKRAGVDCSKSITDLRKMAKNSSGEKQKMAHWCANMKAGKK
jgi:hypothetical protein